MIISRPQVLAQQYAISSGHELATKAGMEILETGGNAIDAGVAAGMALGILHSDLVNFAGVAPIMIRMAETGKTITIDGLGVWPALASVDYFEKKHGGVMPQGIQRTVVPAAPAAWIEALGEYGTMRFGDVAKYAERYAREGFAVYPVFAEFIASNEEAYRRSPATQSIYLPNGRPPEVGEIFVQTELAASIQYMIDEEQSAGGDRLRGIQAARDAFYKGDIARKICDFHIANDGFMRMEDMADYRVQYEEPLSVPFHDAEIVTCGAWCQGISLAQGFRMLEMIDPSKLKHNSADYIHTMTEIFKLVFADREAFVTDPAFVDVPVTEMLDPEYLAKRMALIDMDHAHKGMPPAGTILGGTRHDRIQAGPDLNGENDPHDTSPGRKYPMADPASADTSYVAVIDRDGNMFSATPSDTSADTEVIPGTGLCPSSRGSQSRGTSESINALAPGKRPRLTPNPAIALKDGKPLMAFGTPGGDVQIQAMMQVYVNKFHFGMDIQQAVEAPRFATYSFPSSFAPNTYNPDLLMIEQSIPDVVVEDLIKRGHKVERWQDGTWKAGGVLAVVSDSETGTLSAGADPRRAGTASGR